MCLTVSTVDTIATQSRRQKESNPQARRGSSALPVGCIASLDVLCVTLFPDTVKHTRQGLRRCCICRTDEPGVNVRGGAGLGMAQTARHGGNRHMGCDQQAGVGVPLRYNYDKPEKPRISRVFGYRARFFILFQTEKSSREVVIS